MISFYWNTVHELANWRARAINQLGLTIKYDLTESATSVFIRTFYLAGDKPKYVIWVVVIIDRLPFSVHYLFDLIDVQSARDGVLRAIDSFCLQLNPLTLCTRNNNYWLSSSSWLSSSQSAWRLPPSPKAFEVSRKDLNGDTCKTILL